jgi:hypothetical protein
MLRGLNMEEPDQEEGLNMKAGLIMEGGLNIEAD